MQGLLGGGQKLTLPLAFCWEKPTSGPSPSIPPGPSSPVGPPSPAPTEISSIVISNLSPSAPRRSAILIICSPAQGFLCGLDLAARLTPIVHFAYFASAGIHCWQSWQHAVCQSVTCH